jgi:hypothetical protein
MQNINYTAKLKDHLKKKHNIDKSVVYVHNIRHVATHFQDHVQKHVKLLLAIVFTTFKTWFIQYMLIYHVTLRFISI